MAREELIPRVTVSVHPMWRVRLRRELPRYLVCAASLAGLLASARFAIAPPRSGLAAAAVRGPAPSDTAAESFATLFARHYLTWSSAEPQVSANALEPFLGPAVESDAGLELPESGEQRVEWAEVAQTREPAPGDHVYTVAAQTDTAGLLYLTVAVKRTAAGSLALAGYPAFVGAPAAGPAQAQAHLSEVDDPALRIVVRRVLSNYLSASAGELEADLASGARVSLPRMALSVESMQRLDWASEGKAVLATVRARDARGVQYTLAYELDVAREQGRWEISAVQMDPDA